MKTKNPLSSIAACILLIQDVHDLVVQCNLDDDNDVLSSKCSQVIELLSDIIAVLPSKISKSL